MGEAGDERSGVMVEAGRDAAPSPRTRHRRSAARSRRRPILVVLAPVLALVAAVTACEPVLHQTHTVVSPTQGPEHILALAADGNHVVVAASGPGATVPGAGTWRVDRRDGSAVPVAAVGPVRAISPDGRRISFGWEAAPSAIWVDGAVVTLPPRSFASSDLRWVVYPDAANQVQRLEVETGATTAIEAGFTRPPGSNLWWDDTPESQGISDDGNVIWFELLGSGCVARFINLAFGSVNDFGYCGASVVAANGAAHVRVDGSPSWDNWPHNPIPLPPSLRRATRLDLVDTYTGEILRTVTPQRPGGFFEGVALATSGWVLWTVEVTEQGTFFPDCQSHSNPLPCTGTTTSHEAIAATPEGVSSFPVGSGVLRPWVLSPAFTTNRGGRFLVTTARAGGSVHVVDRAAPDTEVLPPEQVPTWVPMISRDGRLVAYASMTDPGSTFDELPPTWAGWIQHEADPPGG